MRFRSLSLEAYGPFSGLTLDLSAGACGGLHLIYGPNEAGKSSALRAIRDLLFGIPERTQDAHLHPGPALKLGAVIERGGERLAFVRRKKRKDSLLTPDELPLSEAQLSRFLNGLDASSFERLFGLDHERLREGGDEILEGKGDVGEALFDAGASGRSVHGVKLALVAEAEALYKAQAQKPELNRLLAKYVEQKRQAKDSTRSPETYKEQQDKVRELRREVEACRAELGQMRAEKERLSRLKSLLSSVAERDKKAAERALLGEVSSLPSGSAERRERLLQELAEAERDQARLTRELAERRERLARVPPASPISGIAREALRALGTERVKKDLLDLPKRQAEARALRDAIQGELPRLGLGADVESAASRALPVSEQARIQALGRENAALTLKLERAEEQRLEAQARQSSVERELERARAARRIERALLLPAELTERFERELSAAHTLREAALRRVRELERQLDESRQQLEQLERAGEVPSEALLAEARSERELCFRQLEALARTESPAPPALQQQLASLGRASARADELADRLRREAHRVADALALTHTLVKLEQEERRAQEALARAGAQLADLSQGWAQVAATLAAAPLTPREAGRVLQEERDAWREIEHREQELTEARSALQAAEARARAAASAHGQWRTAWAAAVAPLGLGEDARPEQALALLEGLSDIARQQRELAEKERRAEGIRRDIAEYGRVVAEAAGSFAPELSELSKLAPVEAGERLLEQHQRAVAAAVERKALEAEIAGKSAELAAAVSRRDAERADLGALCHAAGVEEPEQLLALERRAQAAAQLEAELAQIDLRLAEVCEGESVSALVAEARSSDRGAVVARLLELDDLLPLREEEARARERELAGSEIGLSSYKGQDAADAAQELSATAARIAELSATWARRRISAFVLERVVESYRERHQGPVLARASELFRRLTLGGFVRLQVGLEEARLECVSAQDGRGLEVDALSEGTRYQLYLALRLASLEQYLAAAPPLPLVLDDVLMTWDDERSKVALSVLAEFSERVQVLLFTHHARDVASAESLHDPRICTHHLPARSDGRRSAGISPAAG